MNLDSFRSSELTIIEVSVLHITGVCKDRVDCF